MEPDAASAASAMDPLDLLIEFFEDGKRWITGEVADAAGNYCLVGAMGYIRDGAPALLFVAGDVTAKD
jgi:hypothetical protein